MSWQAEKGTVPKRYWALWWMILGAAVFVFYVLLTPIWFANGIARGFDCRIHQHWIVDFKDVFGPGRNDNLRIRYCS